MLSITSSQAMFAVQQEKAAEQIIDFPTFTITFSLDDFVFEKLQGYDSISLNQGDYLAEPGQPMVPMKTIRVALPADLRATGIQILEVKEQPVDGTYILYPAQLPRKIGSTDTDDQFIQPDMKTYTSYGSFPSSSLELLGQSDLAGQGIAEIAVYPLHYLPAAYSVTIITSLRFTIEGVLDYVYGDYLPRSSSPQEQERYEQSVKSMVINPENVEVRSSPDPQPVGVDPGDYEYVIITQDSWVSAFQPLADWKTQKGVPASIVTTTWIYNSGEYSGSNVEKIRAFVQDVYTNWGTVFVLLGGDTNIVPCHYRTIFSVDPDSIANDAYYADFDGDWVCEVNVGRASVTGTGTGIGGIGNFINKILTYEKNPPLTEYAKKAAMFGFDLDSSTHAEQCKMSIDTNYIPADWTMNNVYDSQGGNHKTNVISAINAGQNLMNHADHSSNDYMGTGYVNHDWGLGNSDMDALTNGNKQGILYSMGCDPAAYDSSNCIAEHFVRDNNGGGIAFIGNSRYGWYNPGYFNTLSMLYDQYFFRSLLQQNWYKLGMAFTDHKNDYYPNSDIYKYIWTELTLLGDPELPVWTNNPQSLTVDHPNQLPVGPSSFTVHVTSGGSPVDQATVCLWKGTQVYLIDFTNSAGDVLFTPSPTTTGTMFVTVTKQNYLPSENSATVIGGSNNPPQTPAQPTGPLSGKINVEYTYTTSTTDPENDPVWYQWRFGAVTTDWLGPYSSGAQAQASYTWVTPGNYVVKVKAKDTSEYQSEWSPAITVAITESKPELVLGTITGGLLQASVEVQNIGEASATNVLWDISINGTFLLSGQHASGTISALDVDDIQLISDIPVIGFGPVTITVLVSADGILEVTKTTEGFVFLIFVLV